MDEGTAEDYDLIERAEAANNAGLVSRLLSLLRMLGEGEQAYPVSRLEHSLQSASRALRDDRPLDYVVGALLHDIGDVYAPHSHGLFAATILEPFVDPRVTWIVKVHPLFQMHHYAPHMGGRKDAREQYRDHPWFPDAVEFCARYDANCFDPDYPHLPIETFTPMVSEVFARTPWAAPTPQAHPQASLSMPKAH
jgi:predicted HD phosphohydrolase